MGVADGTADMVLVARAFHNWHRAGRTDAFLASFFKALKPGGVLAVEQHRSEDGLNPDVTAPTGYMPESYIIRAAEAAGFVLDARSELNANPKDDRDHPFGVWTLPPVRTSAPRANSTTDRPTPLTEAERAEYDAIGESDRMTLRFRKPG
jgi:predicted methyltransferase